MRIVYVLLGLLLFPILLVFFVPVASSIHGVKVVNRCLLDWHYSNISEEEVDESFVQCKFDSNGTIVENSHAS